MDIENLLNKEIIKLKENEIEEPISKARRLLAFTLNVSKEYLLINNKQEVLKDKIEEFNRYIDKLIEGKPIQYIIGKQNFMGFEFIVNRNVLIPQPDTEILVEKTIEIAKTYKEPRILDLCTGSGAIAISISRLMPNAKVFASDISNEALKVAKINDKENKVTFIKSDMFKNVNEKFDIIVSNPPYIRTEEIKTLSKEVQNEPIIALDGGQDGLNFYRDIIKNASNYLNPNGHLCLETGEDQREDIIDIIKQNKNYADIKAYKDLNGNDRVLIANYT